MVTISRTNSLVVSSRLLASSSSFVPISGAILKLNFGYSIASTASAFRCLHCLRQVNISTRDRRQASPLYFQGLRAFERRLLSPRLRCVFRGLHVPQSSHDE